jgi:hypothetical protein
LASLRYLEDAIGKRFAVLAAILRLSTKYDVPHYRKVTIAKLHELCPPKLAQARQARYRYNIVKDWPNGLTCRWAAPIALARECNVPELVPYCMVRLSDGIGDALHRGLSEHKLLETWTTEDGRTYTLPTEGLASILFGGWRLADRYRKMMVICFGGEGCPEPRDCHDRGAVMIRDELFSFLEGESTYDLWDEPYAGRFADFGICDDCLKTAVATWENEMRVTWRDLPSYFGLPPWPESSVDSPE